MSYVIALIKALILGLIVQTLLSFVYYYYFKVMPLEFYATIMKSISFIICFNYFFRSAMRINKNKSR